MATKVTMSKSGRITLPAEIRRALDLDGEAEFLVEESEQGEGILLRPVVTMLREDAWAYTAEHRNRLERAIEDSREGRIRSLTEEQLDELLAAQ